MFTDRLFTGQRQIAELGIYQFGVRFYSPKLGRFLSADSLVPGIANPQAFNRYSYALNNPVRYSDPTGHMLWEGGGGSYTSPGDDYCATHPWACGSGGGDGGDGDDEESEPAVIVFGGSGGDTSVPGPLPADQLPAWGWNPWGYDMYSVQYPGSKYGQAQGALNLRIEGSTSLICYSAGSESCLIYAKTRIESGYDVPAILLIGPTFSGADIPNAPKDYDIGPEGWYAYMDYAINDGTAITVIDDSKWYSTADDIEAYNYEQPEGSTGDYRVARVPLLHYDDIAVPLAGMNNNPYASFWSFGCMVDPSLCSFP